MPESITFDRMTFYEILDVSSRAEQAVIDKAFEKTKAMYRPEALPLYSLLDSGEAESFAAVIEEAYAVLSDAERRLAYDLGLVKEGKALPSTLLPLERSRRIKDPPAAEEEGKEADPESEIATLPLPGTSEAEGEGGRAEESETREDPPVEKEKKPDRYDGPSLKHWRMTKGIELDSIAAETKISKTHLRAIEDVTRELLPAKVYLRGFLKEYAKCLDLNPEAVATDYMRRIGLDKKEE